MPVPLPFLMERVEDRGTPGTSLVLRIPLLHRLIVARVVGMLRGIGITVRENNQQDVNEKLNKIIKDLVKEKEEKERLNGIIAELEVEKEKHKMEKDVMSNRMPKIEDMLKTMVRK
ncbi:hypothetical protein R6Q59_012370 [Mikania micrantha]